MDPLGRLLFPERTIPRFTKSAVSGDASQPVPGYPFLASNIMAKIWNSVPSLRTATSIGQANSIAKKWAKTVPR